MMKKLAMVVIGWLALTGYVCATETALAERPDKPNVLLLLTDDLGWQDVKCYDIDEPSPMETPNIDALAKKGVMFWQGYSPAPTCAPSRGAIMSGNHPARSQYTHVVGGMPPGPLHKTAHRIMPPWYSGRYPVEVIALPEVLKRNGYTTGHSGKWHLAKKHSTFPEPEDLGFDWSRSAHGVTARMKPHRLTGFATDDPNDPYRLDENGFATHQLSIDALTFVKEHKDKPFFLYYATKLVHAPIHTRSERLLKKYVEKLGVKLPENPQEWTGEGDPWAKLFAFPIKGAVPVFLLEDKRTGKQVITADPYALADTEPYPNPLPDEFENREVYDNRVIYKQYAPHIGYENLLGYAYSAKPATDQV